MSKSVPSGCRRSVRATKGVPPERYGQSSKRLVETNKTAASHDPGEVETLTSNQNMVETETVRTRSRNENSIEQESVRTKTTTTFRRRQLELQLEKERKLAEMQTKIQTRLIEKEMALKQAELAESFRSKSSKSNSQKDDQKTVTSKTSFVNDWIEYLGKFQNPVYIPTSHEEPVYRTKQIQMNQFMARQSISKNLPEFCGQPGEWTNFIIQFKESTEICGLSNAENIVRLRKCLKGKAKESVSALLSFTQEVDAIINTLEKRFSRPEIIIQDLIDSIAKFPNLKEDRMENILDFSNKVKNLAVTVKSFNALEYLSNPQLLNELMKKLNTPMRLEWGKKIVELKREKSLVTVTDFACWLEEISEAATYVTCVDVESGTKKKYVCTTSIQNTNVSPMKCKFCKKEGHKVERCTDFKNLDVEKRWEWARKNKVCFSCLTSSHQTKMCRNKKPCPKDHCTFKHHPLLHKEISAGATRSQELNHCVDNEKNQVVLRIAPVELLGPRDTLHTYALFDEASTVTLIDSKVAEKLGATGPSDPLKIRWTNSITNDDEDSKRISLRIRGYNDNISYSLDNVRTVQNLSLPVQSVNVGKLKNKWHYLRQIDLPDLKNAQPTILIGQDNIDLIIPREIHDGGKNSPVLSKSKLGWIVHGNISRSMLDRSDEDFLLFVRHDYDDLERLVKESFKIDSLGVKFYEKIQSQEDKRALEILDKTTKRISDNRWESGLLWKSDNTNIPNSRTTAITRLHSIEKKMDRDSNFASEYKKKILEYLDKGYARKVPSEELAKYPKIIWYLPHFAVTNPNKPGKIRFVMDAASKSNGVSLNDMLLKGPDLLNSLLGVVFKFRQRNIAFTADIQEMFHQVYIRQEDRSAQRFLWRGEERHEDPEIYEMVAMTFGATSSPATAQYVMRRNALEFKDIFPNAERAIREHHYVDDYLDSKDTLDEAKRLVEEVIEVHRRGGFTIRSWSSNSKELMNSIPKDYASNKIKELDFEKGNVLPVEKVLGLHWNFNEDNFEFSVSWNKIENLSAKNKESITKREALKIIMTIFDPIGFLSILTVKGKIILQDIWRSKIDWDDNLKDEVMKRWRRWITEIENVSKVLIPRSYVPNIYQARTIQLHVFCDASSQAYCAVAYLRVEFDECIKTAFVMAKSRVAPLKPTTIPRLELTSALLGSRLAKTIKELHSIKIHECYFWSDSQIVVSWIKSDPSLFKPFVAHRVLEIKEGSEEKYWNWIPTQENVADEATREDSPIDWRPTSRWLTGPDFLLRRKEVWPRYECNCKDTSETKKKFVGVVANFCNSLPRADRFSTWLRLIRTTAWCLRFIKILRKDNLKGELSPSELRKAEMLWIKQVQSETFSEEIKLLKNKKALEKASKLFSLSPILDEDSILRVRGRTIYSTDLTDEAKFPIILPPKHIYTKLLITYYHIKAHHHGQAYVTNELRQKYWILNIRTAVRSSWNNCQWCKNKRSKPSIPEMSPLPPCRLSSFVRPFTITGMDYFGPMYVTIGRRKEKRYGVLFTCMSVRAIHLEIASCLTTDSTIMSILRMAGRRGWPMKIFSDNGTNLKGADREIRDALKNLHQDEVTAKLSTHGIEWIFNCPLASHHGGSWERLIRSVKTSLTVILKEKAPREETLQTLLIEAEHTVNSRPLVHVSLDQSDEEALTPNHFLLGSSSGIPILLNFEERQLVSRKQWKVSQVLAEHFWKRWVKEYLPELTRRTKWSTPAPREIKPSDVVIITDSDFPKNCWPKGIVTKIYPSKDGKIRAVDIKTKTGVYKRPVTKICVLDVGVTN